MLLPVLLPVREQFGKEPLSEYDRTFDVDALFLYLELFQKTTFFGLFTAHTHTTHIESSFYRVDSDTKMIIQAQDPPRQLVHIQKRVMKYLNHMQRNRIVKRIAPGINMFGQYDLKAMRTSERWTLRHSGLPQRAPLCDG